MEQESVDEQINLDQRLYKEGWELLQGEIRLHGNNPLGDPGWRSRRKLKKAISLFEQVLEINPENWAAAWALGKIYQRLGDDSTALEWFTKASKINPNNPDVLREGSLCALSLGKGKEAIEFAVRAVKLKPNDSGLISNLSLALLLDKRPEEAKLKAEEAVNANPTDIISNNVLTFINDVLSGKRPYPRNLRG